MTKPTTKKFSQLIVEIDTSTNGTPAWTAPCGFNAKALNMTASTSTATLPDCDDPEAPAWEETGVNALAGEVTGSGVMAAENAALWEGWLDSGDSKPIRIRIPGVGYRTGNGVLTALGATAQLASDANRIQRSVTIKNDGPWIWTAGDPS